MKNIRTITLLLCALIALTTQAQKRKATKRTTPKKEVVVEKTPGEILYDEMLPSTAKVMFVDSIVVSKDDFLKKIIIDSEAGQLTESKGLISYTNEFGTQQYQTVGNELKGIEIIARQSINGAWSDEKSLFKSEAGIVNPCNPFMLADGTTLFFAAQGEKSIGGYDIFMTTYSAESARFYEPNNYGLPFNSKYNEYFLAIDEFNNLGWLVSDRYLNEDSVCIYIFEPTAARMSYESDNISDEELKSRADIRQISDTWTVGNHRAAEKRIAALSEKKQDNAKAMTFAIDDNRTYHSKSEFKSVDAKKKFDQLLEMREMLSMQNKSIDELRVAYKKAPVTQRGQLKTRIIGMEESIDQLEKDIKNTEKEIRRIETGN